MFVSLTKAREWLCAEPCIVCYSDIVFHDNAVKRLMECGREFAITYYTGFLDLWRKRFSNPLEDMETFRLNPDGTLAEIGLRPQSEDEVQGQYMGLLRFEPSGWEKIEQAIRLPMKKSVEKLDMTTLLNHLISLGYPVYAIASEERWLECDNQEDIRLYERLYPNGGKKHG